MSSARRHQAGFTLIELAIVIAVIGLISASGLSLLAGSMRGSQARTTQERLDLAVQALLAYYAANNHFPCPANGSLAPGNSAYGVAPTSCGTAATQGNGVLPWRTLGLPDLSAQDGWNRLLSYRIDPSLTGSTATATTLDIRYQDTPTVTGNAAVLAVFSHGANGLGARIGQSGQLVATAGQSATEAENNNADNIFIARALTPPAGDSYDDLMVWRTEAQVKQTLGLFPGATCISATTLVNAICPTSPTDDRCVVANAVRSHCIP